MIYLIGSIALSVLLLINFRIFPKYSVNTFQAIVFNYPVCFLIGMALMPEGQHFSLDLSQNWTWYCLALGVGFIVTFLLSGISTQQVGITITSLANNISLVIPVLFSLFVFKSQNKVFDNWNYLGLVLAIVAVAAATYKPSTGEKKAFEWKSFWYSGGVTLSVFLMYGITNTVVNYLNIHYIPNPEQTVPVTLVMIFGALISGFVVLIFRLIKGTEKIELKSLVGGVSLGIPNFLSFYFLILALSQFGNSGAFVYPIYNIGVILGSSLVAFLFFKEKISSFNRFGLFLALLAIILISYQEIMSY